MKTSHPARGSTGSVEKRGLGVQLPRSTAHLHNRRANRPITRWPSCVVDMVVPSIFQVLDLLHLFGGFQPLISRHASEHFRTFRITVERCEVSPQFGIGRIKSTYTKHVLGEYSGADRLTSRNKRKGNARNQFEIARLRAKGSKPEGLVKFLACLLHPLVILVRVEEIQKAKQLL